MTGWSLVFRLEREGKLCIHHCLRKRLLLVGVGARSRMSRTFAGGKPARLARPRGRSGQLRGFAGVRNRGWPYAGPWRRQRTLL